MFYVGVRSGSPWRQVLKVAILARSCLAFGISEVLNPRTSVPAPILVPASQDWEGSDGPWSSFALQIGTPPQVVKTFVSTASTQTWAVAPEGCIPSDPSDCRDTRGRIYSLNDSTSWVPNLANATTTIYDLGLEAALGYSGVGQYGFDNITLGILGMGGPSLKNQTLAAISTTDFWLGIFGLNPRPSNFTTFNDPIPSYIANLRSQSLIPSTSWAYTAGNQYRFNQVLGSLTLGGYDASKFIPNNLTWEVAPEDDRDLIVQIEGITTGSGTALLDSAIPAFLDSTVPYIYLPLAACTLFEEAFGLMWDNATGLYLLNDTQHTNLKYQNPNITFTIGNLTSATKVDIKLPYSAFDLTVTYPHVSNPTKYFPLKRADDVKQYTLGRTFFQEAYVIADYDRRKFSVSQCKWDGQTQSIVAIIPPSNGTANGTSTDGPIESTTKDHKLPIGAIAGGAGGGLLIIIGLALLFCLLRRRKNAKKTADEANTVEPVLKPELDGYERTPKLYNTAPEVDFYSEGKKFAPRQHAVEIGESGRNSPVYEMAAEEVAVEMPSVRKSGRNFGGRGLGLGSASPDSPIRAERTAMLNWEQPSDTHIASPLSGLRGISPASPASPGSVGTSLVSPTSLTRDARSPRTTSVVSPTSLVYMDRPPADELWIEP